MHCLMLLCISFEFKIYLEIIKNLTSSKILQILVSVISFTFFTLATKDSASFSFGELRIRLTGTKKGYKSLKQYVSRRYFTVSTGVE